MEAFKGVTLQDWACATANTAAGMTEGRICEVLGVTPAVWKEAQKYWAANIKTLLANDPELAAVYGTYFTNPQQGKFARVESGVRSLEELMHIVPNKDTYKQILASLAKVSGNVGDFLKAWDGMSVAEWNKISQYWFAWKPEEARIIDVAVSNAPLTESVDPTGAKAPVSDTRDPTIAKVPVNDTIEPTIAKAAVIEVNVADAAIAKAAVVEADVGGAAVQAPGYGVAPPSAAGFGVPPAGFGAAPVGAPFYGAPAGASGYGAHPGSQAFIGDAGGDAGAADAYGVFREETFEYFVETSPGVFVLKKDLGWKLVLTGAILLPFSVCMLTGVYFGVWNALAYAIFGAGTVVAFAMAMLDLLIQTVFDQNNRTITGAFSTNLYLKWKATVSFDDFQGFYHVTTKRRLNVVASAGITVGTRLDMKFLVNGNPKDLTLLSLPSEEKMDLICGEILFLMDRF